MRWFALFVPLLFAVLSGCAMNRVTAYNTVVPAQYTLDTGDVVRVTVYGDTTLTNTYTVTDKGTLSLPLAGEVAVRGEAITAVEQQITTLLARGYMINPKVSVEITTYRPFFIEGAVKTSGQFPYVYGMTARAAVATAGGFADYADRGRVTVYRRVGGVMTKRTIGLDDTVLPGDTIVINERWL
jgi:polysaccharide export outer membrane protein